MQTIVHRFSRLAFNFTGTDEFFALVRPANPTESNAFAKQEMTCKGPTPGPDRTALQLDVTTAIIAPWNDEVMHLFYSKLMNDLDYLKDIDNLPDISEDLWLYMIHNKCQTLMNIWKSANVKALSNGMWETPEQAVACYMQEQKENEKRTRQRERRAVLRFYIFRRRNRC